MPDFADLAAAREQELRDDALAEHRRRAHASRSAADGPGLSDGGFPAADDSPCAVCGEPIPAARRQAVPGCDTCIDCQEELERALAGATPRAPKRRRKAAP